MVKEPQEFFASVNAQITGIRNPHFLILLSSNLSVRRFFRRKTKMELLATSSSTGTAREAVSAEVREAGVDSVAREMFLTNIPYSQVINSVPLVLLGLCSLYLPEWRLMAILIILQGSTIGSMYMLTRKLRRASLQEHARTLWRAFEIFAFGSGVLWAAMMLPVIATLGHGVAGMFVCVIIIVTVAITSMVVAIETRIFGSFLLGFMFCIIPQAFYFLDVIGPVPLAATIGLAPALLGLTKTVRKQTRLLIRTQLEKQHLAEELSRALAAAEYLSARDALTGLYNRRAFEEIAARITRTHDAAPLALILVDLDDFKAINDRYGHATGDSVLRSSAELIARHVGLQDLVGRGDGAIARWGGEEFILLLPNCSAQRAFQVAEKLQCELLALRNPEWPAGLAVTGSFGIAQWMPEIPLHTAIAMADEAMYSAKNGGKNRICVHSEDGGILRLQTG